MLEKETERNSQELAFIHDISNPLSIAYGHVKILVSKLESDPGQIDIEAIIVKLNKSVSAFERANQLLDERRNQIK